MTVNIVIERIEPYQMRLDHRFFISCFLEFSLQRIDFCLQRRLVVGTRDKSCSYQSEQEYCHYSHRSEWSLFHGEPPLKLLMVICQLTYGNVLFRPLL